MIFPLGDLSIKNCTPLKTVYIYLQGEQYTHKARNPPEGVFVHYQSSRQRANFRNSINKYVNAEVLQRASVRETARLCCDVTAEWLQPQKNKRGKFLTPKCYIALAHYRTAMAVVWKIKGGHSQDSHVNGHTLNYCAEGGRAWERG